MMRTSQTRRLGLVCVLLIHATGLVAQDLCTEGICKRAENNDTYLLCASQIWQTMSSNGYICVSGVLVFPGAEQTSTLGLNSTQSYKQIVQTQTTPFAGEQLDSPLCTPSVQKRPTSPITSSQSAPTLVPQAWQPSQDSYGIRSYAVEGKMASVYDADSNSVFRCDDLTYPSDGYYVAFYTPYNSTLAIEGKSQPAPANCGHHVDFKNPLTGVSATALVLDRCASCIGVGGQLNDPNTDQSLVNGATVDFSRALWDKIYNHAPNNVYDVQYAGKVLQGIL